MIEFKSPEQIRIKDIAEKAGLSVGTVDRVLHGRPNVSKKARERVEAVLKEINYQPNMYASALASNKKYHFHCLLPEHDQSAYWISVEQGLHQSITNRRDFHLSLGISYYNQFDAESFEKSAEEMLNVHPDGVIIVPQEHTPTKKVCEKLTAENIPFIFLDSNYTDIDALAFFGQDPIRSGIFAARMLMLQAAGSKDVFLIRLINQGRVASKQQEYREVGFRQYMREFHPECRITELNLEITSTENITQQLDKFFATHKNIHHGITFSSRVHMVGEYLLKNNRRDIKLMGYDILEPNLECLKKGIVNFLIAQHSWRQGYECIKALFNHLVMRKEILRDNYMPIELLTLENYIFYNKK